MITNFLSILALLATMSTQPAQPTADAPAKATAYCLSQPVDYPHLPWQDICPITSPKEDWMPRP